MFGAYNRDFITRGEGFSLLILESKDANRDAATFTGAGIGESDALRFEREAKKPDGSSVKVGFSLAFAEDSSAHDIHFAACQQHYPENFWNPAFQQHPNGVAAVAGVVVVAEQPPAVEAEMAAFAPEPAAMEPTPVAATEEPIAVRRSMSRRETSGTKGVVMGASRKMAQST
jgi:hypothetical protein